MTARVMSLSALALLLATTTFSLRGDATLACTGLNGSDSFEAHTLYAAPSFPSSSNCLYTNAGGGGTVVPNPSGTGKVWSNEGSLTTALNVAGDPCSNAQNPTKSTVQYTFRFYWPAVSAGGSADLLIVGSGLMGIAFRGDLGNAAATMGVHAKTSAGSQLYTAFAGAPVPQADTWYRASLTIADTTITDASCDVAATVTAVVSNDAGTVLGGRTVALRGNAGAAAGDGFVGFSALLLVTGTQSSVGRQAYLDDLSISGFPGASATAKATATVADLYGFDVDLSGTTLIVRHGAAAQAQQIATYPAQSMSAATATLDSLCNARFYGVMASATNVAYLQCDENTGIDTELLTVVSPSLEAQILPEYCEGVEGFEPWNINQDGLSRVHNMEFGGIEFAVGDERFDDCTVQATTGWTDLDGRIGLMRMIRFAGTHDQNLDSADAQYVAASKAGSTKICVSQNYNPVTVGELVSRTQQSDYYLIAVNVDATTRTYKRNLQSGELDLVRTAPGALANAGAVSCGFTNTTSARSLVAANGQIYGYNFLTGSVAWSHPATVPSDGTAVSWDSGWGAFYNTATGQIQVVAMDDGQYRLNITAPTGTVLGLDLDSTAQNLWVAMLTAGNDFVYRYEIYGATTGAPVAPGDTTPNVVVPGEFDPTGDGANSPPEAGDWRLGAQVFYVIVATVIGMLIGGVFSKWNSIAVIPTGYLFQLGAVFHQAHDLWVIPILCACVAAAILVFRRR